MSISVQNTIWWRVPISKLKNWNGKEIEAIQTKGGVWAFPDYLDGVVCPPDSACPPPELVQKLSRSDKYIHFHPEDQPLITQQLGYYTDLQSAHSEDAMVWSCLGTLASSAPRARVVWAQWLVNKLGYDPVVNNSAICLWRRVPHPDNFTQGGPELDALIQTDKIVILAEAKWRSGESRWQGMDGRSSRAVYPGSRQRPVSRAKGGLAVNCSGGQRGESSCSGRDRVSQNHLENTR